MLIGLETQEQPQLYTTNKESEKGGPRQNIQCSELCSMILTRLATSGACVKYKICILLESSGFHQISGIRFWLLGRSQITFGIVKSEQHLVTQN